MGRIMTAPFEHRDEEKWEMTAIALNGSVYVELHDPPDVRKERRNRQSAHAIQSYMGYSYESFSTVPAPGQVGENFEGQHESWSGDVNTNVQVSPPISVSFTADNKVVQVRPILPTMLIEVWFGLLSEMCLCFSVARWTAWRVRTACLDEVSKTDAQPSREHHTPVLRAVLSSRPTC